MEVKPVSIFQFVVEGYEDIVYTAMLVNEDGLSYWSVIFLEEDDTIGSIKFPSSQVADYIKGGYWEVLF